jgi:uncharacterized protein
MKRLIGLALVAATTLAHAQTTAIPGAPSSAAKKEMIQRLLVIQQPALESMTRDLIERPARQMMGAAEEALEVRVAPEKRPEAVKKIQDLLTKYREETTPLIKDRASRIGQSSLAPIFEEKYTEDELKQLLAALEAPAYKKFQASLPELTNSYAQAVVKDLEPIVQPKVKSLEMGVAAALGVPAPGTTPPSAAKPAPKAAAPAASKPAAKK